MSEESGYTIATNGERALALEDGVFQLRDWLPYEFSYIANRVSAVLAKVYTERFKLSVTGWRIVGVLANFAPLSATELANRTAMNQVSITRAIAALVKLRMVNRHIDRKDRRKVVLTLTAEGMAAYREVVPIAIGVEAELLQDLSPHQRDALKEMMRIVSDRASQALSDTRDWRDFR